MCTYYCRKADVGPKPAEAAVAEAVQRHGHAHIPAGRFYSYGTSAGEPMSCWTLPLNVPSSKFEEEFGFPTPVQQWADVAREIARDGNRPIVPVAALYRSRGDGVSFAAMSFRDVAAAIDAGNVIVAEEGRIGSGSYCAAVLEDGTRWYNRGNTPLVAAQGRLPEWRWMQVKE